MKNLFEAILWYSLVIWLIFYDLIRLIVEAVGLFFFILFIVIVMALGAGAFHVFSHMHLTFGH